MEVSILHIINVNFHHVGEYLCHAANKDKNELDFSKISLNVSLEAKVLKASASVEAKLHQNTQLYCLVEGYPFETLTWYKDNEELAADLFDIKVLSKTLRNMTLEITELSRKDNGTYTCLAEAGNSAANKSIPILVLDKPQVNIDFVKAIGKNRVYLNWTVNDGNAPSTLFFRIQYMAQGDSNWYYYQQEIGGGNHSYVLQDIFKNNTEYWLRIMAINSEGESQYSTTTTPILMLNEDPEFIPDVKVTGVTVNSITISWGTPPDELKDHVHMYKLLSQAENSADKFEALHPASGENLYMFSDLQPATTYNFQVAACSEYSNLCGNWSLKVNGTTMDGISGPPANVTVECRFDNISQTSFVYVSWKPPVSPHGTIMSYNVSFFCLLNALVMVY